MLNRLTLGAVVLATVLTVTGCVGLMGPGGAITSHAGIYTAVTQPSSYNPTTVHQFNASDFTRRDPVKVTGETKNILGIIASGDAGYDLLMKEAQKQGADALIDVYMDVDYCNILGVYGVATYKMFGTPIVYN